MTQSSSVAGLIRSPPKGPGARAPARASSAGAPRIAFARADTPAPAPWPARVLRRAAGPALAVLAIVAVVVRQLTSNAAVPDPSGDAEATLGVNAYALLHAADLGLPGSLSDAAASWQLAGYSYLTSATDRHASLVGSTREFVFAVCLLTALLVMGVCRRLQLGWLGTSLAVLLSGAPGLAALLRIVSVPTALAAFWLTLAALCAVAAADRQRRRWPLVGLAVLASVVAVLTAGAAILAVLGLFLGIAATRGLDGAWDSTARIAAVLSLTVALIGASWVTIWGPQVSGEPLAQVGIAGTGIAVGGLIVAVACVPIAWLRPVALGAVPLLLSAAWPGPAQAPAMLLGLSLVAILAAGLLDTLLRRGRAGEPVARFELETPRVVATRRFPVASVFAAASLLVVVTVGTLLLPAPVPTAATPTPDGVAASWIRTQLDPDAIIQVDPLSRAALARNGVDPARLTTADVVGDEVEFLLGPLDSNIELPMVAQFGIGASALGLRLAVADPAAFNEALVVDAAARASFGAALASNPNVTLGPAASAALRAGEVDARLMVALAGAAAATRFTAEFISTVGDPSTGWIYRAVTLGDITDLEATAAMGSASNSALRWLNQFFDTQQPPFQPLAVLASVDTLTLRYPAPSPLGLLP